MSDIFDTLETGQPVQDIFDQIAPDKITAGQQLKKEFSMGTEPVALEKVPFAGGLVATFNKANYAEAKKRLESGEQYPLKRLGVRTATDYRMERKPGISAEEAIAGKEFEPMTGKELVPVTREEDEELVRSYEARMYAPRTWGATVTKGAAQLPTYMAEFAMTNSLYNEGKLIVGAGAKSGTLRKLFGWFAGSTARTVGFAPRVAEQVAERRLQVDFGRAPNEDIATSLLKGWNTVLIENLSEVTGENITKGLGWGVSKLPFGKQLIPRLREVWMKATGGTTAEFARRILSKGGYSNIIGEIGEERLATIMHAIANTQNFGTPKDASVGERIWAGIKSDFKLSNITAEAAVLMIPTLAAKVASKFNTINLVNEAENIQQTIAQSKELTPEEKEEGLRYIGDIETEILSATVERFPGEIETQQDLEQIGNEIKKYLGIDKKVKWTLAKKPARSLYGQLKNNNEIILYPGNAPDIMKETIVHELGHMVERPLGARKLTEKEKQEWRERGVSEETLNRMTKGNRRVHHPKFNKWVENNIKKLYAEEREVNPIHRQEAIGPIGQQAQIEKPTIEQMAQPRPPSRKKLLNLGHKIAKKAKWSDMQRRDFMEQITGKRSMKDMSKDQMQQYVDALIKETGIEPAKPKKGNDPIQLGNRVTTMNDIMEQAGQEVSNLPNKIEIPEHVKRNFVKKQRGGFFRKAKHLLWGIDNSPLYQLANILEMGKSGIFTEVFDANLQKGRRIEAAHKRSAQNLLEVAFEQANITPQDLAEISNSANPRATWYQFLQEKTGEGTKIQQIKINNKTFDMNMGELLDVYLISQQEQGMAHLLGGGLVVNGVETGALLDTDITRLQTYVETNPKALAIAQALTAVQENIWKPSLNQTATELGEEPIATVKNWWGFEVYYPKQLPGKEQKFNVNLFENKSIFHQRTNSERPLVVRDAFQRFLAFENAISEYVAFAQPLRIARTVINDPDLAAEIDKKGYKDVQNNMRSILDRIQSVQRPSGKLETFISNILPGVYRAVLFFNPRVIMSQYTSVTNYAAFVSPGYLKNLNKGISKQTIQETLDISDIAWDRFYMGHSSYELGELGAADSVLKFFTKTSADINKLGITLKLADMAALSSGLEIAKAEYKDAQNGNITGESSSWWADKDVSAEEGSEGWRNAVTSRAEWLWQRSQPSWDKWNRSVVTSDPSAIRRVFFLFRSFHEKSLAIMQSASTEYENSNKTLEDRARYAKKMGAVLSGYTLNTVLRGLIMAGLLRELKEPFEYISDIVTAPFAMMPILGKILQTSIRNFINVLNESAPEYRGEAVESLPIKIINTIAQAPDNFTRAFGYYLMGEDEKAEKALKKAIGNVYEGVGTSVGVPTSEIKRVNKGWFEEEETGGRRTRRTRSRKR